MGPWCGAEGLFCSPDRLGHLGGPARTGHKATRNSQICTMRLSLAESFYTQITKFGWSRHQAYHQIPLYHLGYLLLPCCRLGVLGLSWPWFNVLILEHAMAVPRLYETCTQIPERIQKVDPSILDSNAPMM